MIDRATHWFYAEQQMSAGAAIENMRHDLWANGFYTIWLTLKKSESPYLISGLWGQDKFEIEFEPRKYFVIRSAKELPWLEKAFTRALGMGPHFQYQDKSNQFSLEWRMADREARWQSMQGVPVFKNLRRFDVVSEV